jgi:S-adenosylmethionine:tRNA ribosyltransferase-isomerase
MSDSLADYDYSLPAELIADRPLAKRDDARMLVLDRATGEVQHRQFRELKSFVTAGDIVVLNDTRVMAARRFSDDGTIEFLFLERLGEWCWKCLVKPGRKMRVGSTTRIDGAAVSVTDICAEGERIVTVDRDIDLQSGGLMPLPPYLGRQSDTLDETRYQTVFATAPGAVAAPTAGLHFTPELLAELPHTFVTLHVGTGTFRPVQSANLAEHKMHTERFSISADAAAAINAAKRTLAVGTTSVRVLEAARHAAGELIEQQGETDIFIRPPHDFRAVDRLLTNFHLPRSTLLMLVSAFAGREFVLRAYQEAIRERYRFYSYGDCMLIL